MARRPLHDEPISKIAVWSSRLGLFAFAVAALSIIIVRPHCWRSYLPARRFRRGTVFAGLAILLSFAAFVVIWKQGLPGLGRALLGLFLGLALLAYPAYLAWRAISCRPFPNHHRPGLSPRFEVLGAVTPTRARRLSRPDRGRTTARRLSGYCPA